MKAPAAGTLRVFDDTRALAAGAAEFICERAEASHRRFVFSLAGGSTPKPVYAALAGDTLVKRFPWERTQFVFGDERFVPPNDPDSNFRMVREAMFSRAPVPEANIHGIPTVGGTPEQCADQYERTLVGLNGGPGLPNDRPLHDLMLLGMGDDGHTASLIPGEPVLAERTRWVAVVGHGRPEVRLTLTYPAIESSAVTIFLVAGAGKRAILDRVLSGGADVPSARLRPHGELFWFVDRAAAGRWAP